MGLTIHYSLQSTGSSAEQARELLVRLREKALDLPFQHVSEIIDVSGDAADIEKVDREAPNRWLLTQAEQYVVREGVFHPFRPNRVIGFTTNPGEGSEPANFGFAVYPKTVEILERPPSGRRYVRVRRAGAGQAFAKRSMRRIPRAVELRISCAAIWPLSRCSTTPPGSVS